MAHSIGAFFRNTAVMRYTEKQSLLLYGMSSTVAVDESDDDDLDISFLPSIIDPSKAVRALDENDVICGRGKSVTHPGNLKSRYLV